MVWEAIAPASSDLAPRWSAWVRPTLVLPLVAAAAMALVSPLLWFLLPEGEREAGRIARDLLVGLAAATAIPPPITLLHFLIYRGRRYHLDADGLTVLRGDRVLLRVPAEEITTVVARPAGIRVGLRTGRAVQLAWVRRPEGTVTAGGGIPGSSTDRKDPPPGPPRGA